MKGFDVFLSSLLPSIVESGRIKFEKNSIESSLKEKEGQMIIRSKLTTKNKVEEEICIPFMAQLQKAYKALDCPVMTIQYEQDIAYRMALKGSDSKVSLFLMDKDLISWPALTKEPDYSLIVELPLKVIESLKMNFTLVDGTNTTVSLEDGKLTFKVGDETHENSASTVIDVDVEDEYAMTIRTESLSSIVNSIPDASIVTLSASAQGLTKIEVKIAGDEFAVVSEYFLIASQ